MPIGRGFVERGSRRESRSGLRLIRNARRNLRIVVPAWIMRRRAYIIRYLRGLYGAEGSYSVHKPTDTYKLNFSNTNQSLLKNVEKLLRVLGLSPHYDSSRVQISKEDHVTRALKLLEFRQY